MVTGIVVSSYGGGAPSYGAAGRPQARCSRFRRPGIGGTSTAALRPPDWTTPPRMTGEEDGRPSFGRGARSVSAALERRRDHDLNELGAFLRWPAASGGASRPKITGTRTRVATQANSMPPITRAAERAFWSPPLAEAERHRHHAEHHGNHGHDHRPGAASPALRAAWIAVWPSFRALLAKDHQCCSPSPRPPS